MRNKACFACGRLTMSVFTPPADDGLPLGGVLFTAEGNFGSAVWDMPGYRNDGYREHLQITICDECLRDRKDRVLHCKPERVHIPVRYSAWDPDHDPYARDDDE
jgi:hypothetical protein